jgi:hypothetical protein
MLKGDLSHMFGNLLSVSTLKEDRSELDFRSIADSIVLDMVVLFLYYDVVLALNLYMCLFGQYYTLKFVLEPLDGLFLLNPMGVSNTSCVDFSF